MKRLLIYFSALILFACTPNSAKQKIKTSATIKKDTVQVADTLIKEPVANTAKQIMVKPQVPVLCFHHISDGPKSEYRVSPTNFKADIKMLVDSGYHSILPSQLYDYLVYNKPLPQKPVMISFDDSNGEQATVAAPILEKYGYRGVFFIMTVTYNKKNYMSENQIASLAKAGNTIGLHSWDHTVVTKYLKDADWQKQVVKPRAKLEKIVGMPVDYWAYPDGIFNHVAAEGLNKYFKISFILSNKRDSILPLQTVRRMIVPNWPAHTVLRAMQRTFATKK